MRRRWRRRGRVASSRRRWRRAVSAALDERTRWVAPNHVGSAIPWRITLTLPVIDAAREVLLVVCGAEKAEVLRAVAEAPEEPPPELARRHPVLLPRPSGRMAWLI